jgi:hypothetical protein
LHGPLNQRVSGSDSHDDAGPRSTAVFLMSFRSYHWDFESKKSKVVRMNSSRFNVLKTSVECLAIGSLDQGTSTSARQFMKCSHLGVELAWCRDMSSDTPTA